MQTDFFLEHFFVAWGYKTNIIRNFKSIKNWNLVFTNKFFAFIKIIKERSQSFKRYKSEFKVEIDS